MDYSEDPYPVCRECSGWSTSYAKLERKQLADKRDMLRVAGVIHVMAWLRSMLRERLVRAICLQCGRDIRTSVGAPSFCTDGCADQWWAHRRALATVTRRGT